MARHNDISLYATILSNPSIADLGTKKKAVLPVKVIRGDRNAYDGEVQTKATTLLVVTTSPYLIETIEMIKENDIVLIKGNIITTTSPKPIKCKCCGYETKADGIFVYINPIAISIIKQNISKEQANEILTQNKEFSNEACIIGHLCCDPEQIAAFRSTTVVQYKIGIPRKFNLKWDPDNLDIKADFPYVKSYGQNALKDMEHLKKGSTVLIDGFLQSRRFDRKTECESCGKEIEWQDGTIEIVPYQTEYLRNLKTDSIDKDAEYIANVTDSGKEE